MGDVLGFIQKRRSIRQYKKGAAVSDAQVETLLRAAMAAPSAGNQQPWHFVVVRDRAKLEGIMQIHPYAGMLKTASLAIVVCGDLSNENYKRYCAQDCAAATQNILLAAHSKGLGTVWTTVFPDNVKAVQALLNIPENVRPFSCVPVGYSAEGEKNTTSRFDEKKIHRQSW